MINSNMDQSFQEDKGSEMKETRRSNLMKSLSKMRVAERCDVRIISCGKQFLAHSLVLEASSIYFRSMLSSNLQEAKVRKIVLDDFAPTTIDAILDFVYTGEVELMETVDEVMNVLRAAHLMQLDQLVDYCWDVLTASMSSKNVNEVIDISAEFQNQDITFKAFNYIIANVSKIVSSSEFYSLSSETLKDFLAFSAQRRVCMDKLLAALCTWLLREPEERKPLIPTLFATIDVHLLSEAYLKSLLEWKEFLNGHAEVRQRLKDLLLQKDASSNDLMITYGRFRNVVDFKARLIFLSEYKRKEVYDPVKDCRVMQNVQHHTVQQFDLNTGSWLPAKDLPFSGCKGAAICHHKTHLYLAGGKLCPAYVMYDPDTNEIEYPGFGHGVDATNAGLCFYKDHLYIVGGSSADGEEPKSQVLYIAIGSLNWCPSKSMLCKRSSPTVLTTEEHIYVGGGTNYSARFTIEYATGCKDKLHWELLHIPHQPSRAVGMRWFVLNSTLHGLYYTNGQLILVKHDQEINKLVTKKSAFGLPGITSVFTPSFNCDKVFVTNSVPLCIPEYVLDPESDNWVMLTDSIQRSSSIPEDEPMLVVCTLCS